MAVDHQRNRIVFECDACTEIFESPEHVEWADAWNEAKREGWRSRKIAGEWVHVCGKCKL